MDLQSIPMFAMMTRRMDWHAKRQDVLASNIANANTPNFQPRDLEAFDFDRVLNRKVRPVQIALTSPGHLRGLVPEVRGERMDETYETTPSGNAVSLEEQAVLVAKNAMDHTLATQLYGKNLSMLRMAMRGGGN